MILRWMITKGNETKPQVVWIHEFARLEDGARNLFNVLGGGRDIAALTSGTVLNEDEISATSKLIEGSFWKHVAAVKGACRSPMMCDGF